MKLLNVAPLPGKHSNGRWRPQLTQSLPVRHTRCTCCPRDHLQQRPDRKVSVEKLPVREMKRLGFNQAPCRPEQVDIDDPIAPTTRLHSTHPFLTALHPLKKLRRSPRPVHRDGCIEKASLRKVFQCRSLVDPTHTLHSHFRVAPNAGYCQPQAVLPVSQATSEPQSVQHLLQPKSQHVSLRISCAPLENLDHPQRTDRSVHVNDPVGVIGVIGKAGHQA